MCQSNHSLFFFLSKRYLPRGNQQSLIGYKKKKQSPIGLVYIAAAGAPGHDAMPSIDCSARSGRVSPPAGPEHQPSVLGVLGRASLLTAWGGGPTAQGACPHIPRHRPAKIASCVESSLAVTTQRRMNAHSVNRGRARRPLDLKKPGHSDVGGIFPLGMDLSPFDSEPNTGKTRIVPFR